MFRRILAAVGVLSAIAPAAQGQITPRPEVLTGAFQPGFVGEADEARYPVRVIRLGEVGIASGRVLLVDPFLMSTRDTPLALTVRPGRYPVDLAVADAGESGQRVPWPACCSPTRPPSAGRWRSPTNRTRPR